MKKSFPIIPLTIFSILLLLTSCQSYNPADPPKINNRIPNLKIQTKQSTNQSIIVQQTQTLKINLPDNLYNVGSTILELRNPNGLKLRDAVDNHSSEFVESKSCKFNDPDIKVTETFTRKIDAQGRKIYDKVIDHKDQKVYLRTYAGYEVYSIADQSIVQIGQCQNPTDLDNYSLAFQIIDGKVCVTDGKEIFYFEINPNSHVPVTLTLWSTLDHETGDFNRRDFKATIFVDNFLLVLGDTYYRIFSYNKTTSTFSLFTNMHSDEELRKELTSGNFVDAIWTHENPNNLYILTDIDGMIEIKDFKSRYIIVKHSIHQLGQGLFFKRFGDAFEVVFRLTGYSPQYVAEFFYGKGSTQMILNRIYSKVNPVMDIDYFNGQLLILAQKQFHIYGPAVNRKLLMQPHMNEYPYVGYNYDVQEFEVLFLKSTKNITKMLAINKKSISLYDYERAPAYISCELRSDTDLIISTVGTCNRNTVTLMATACQYTDLYDVKVIYEFSAMEALAVTLAVIGVVACLGCGGILPCLKGVFNIRKRIASIKEKVRNAKLKKNSKKVAGVQLVQANSTQNLPDIKNEEPSGTFDIGDP